jgi:hypothetical protein
MRYIYGTMTFIGVAALVFASLIALESALG